MGCRLSLTKMLRRAAETSITLRQSGALLACIPGVAGSAAARVLRTLAAGVST